MNVELSIPLPAAHALKKLVVTLPWPEGNEALRRGDMAARLFVSRDTLWRLERGDPSVALGTLATAIFILQMHDRLARLQRDAEIAGHRLEQPGPVLHQDRAIEAEALRHLADLLGRRRRQIKLWEYYILQQKK